MSNFNNDNNSGEGLQSPEDLHPVTTPFGAGAEVFDDTAEMAAESFFRKDFRDALRQFSRMLALDDSRTEGWVGYVLSLLFNGEVQQAVIWAKNAESSLPENLTAKTLHVLMHVISRSKPPIAPERIEQVESAESEDPLFWILRGWLVLEQKKSDKLEHFHKAGSLAGSDNWQVPMLAAMILEQYGKTGSAARFYKQSKDNFRNKFSTEVKPHPADVPEEEPGGSGKNRKNLVSRMLHRQK